MPRPQLHGTGPAVAPPLGEEHHRAAALDQAGLLERRHLIDGRGDDHSAGHVAARLVPGQERRVDRANQFEQGVCRQARRRPHEQIAGDEQRRRVGRRPFPRARWPSRRRSYMSTVGATEGNIIAAIITTQTVMKKPRPPRLIPGTDSMPPIRSWVTSQATTASASSTPSRASWVRSSRDAAARALHRAASKARPPRRTGWRSRSPLEGEVDPERAQVRFRRAGDGDLRPPGGRC